MSQEPSTSLATEPSEGHASAGATPTVDATPIVAAGEGEGGPLPPRLGSYVPFRWLGAGGFGKVCLARDDRTGCLVAIKIPRAEMLASPEQMQALLSEAKVASGLKHPGIVAVLEIGASGDGVPFIVMEFIEGPTLSALMQNAPPPARQLAEILSLAAEAAHYAHMEGLVHRDLKPANILIDARGLPHIADFGLAVHEDFQWDEVSDVAGTPPYMAPEQVRGETHRLDGRTDVWALGVILYRGLRGRPPFAGRDRREIFDEILHRDPKPPRQRADVPRELERICLKCLAKRMGDRYRTCDDLADDLRNWLACEASTSESTPVSGSSAEFDRGHARVVPKGLRAFDREDADFFLTLLPGARDRDGLPESIRTWKAWVERRDAESSATPIGLIYGPSGCGKSSLVKAGLLPRLARGVRAVYVEASPRATEGRLLAALRREVPDLPAEATLVEATAAIRARLAARSGAKVLIVIDQFEQWMHHHPDVEGSELVRALRQCDGTALQALVLVRDDFWMAITRFLRALDVELVEGRNSSAVELFDAAHARRVLIEFGRSRGGLPDDAEAIGPDAGHFLDSAVSGLAGDDGQIIPVRLNLFAETVRHRPWTTATLRELGGIEGIGVTFLEQTFDGRTIPPSHRRHRKAAEAVLRALLPAPTSMLKGVVRPGRRSSTRGRRLLGSARGFRRADADPRRRTADGHADRHRGPRRPGGRAAGRPGGDLLPAHARLPRPPAAAVAEPEAEDHPARPGRASPGIDHGPLARPARSATIALAVGVGGHPLEHELAIVDDRAEADDAIGGEALPLARRGRAGAGGPRRGLRGRAFLRAGRRSARRRSSSAPTRPTIATWPSCCRRSTPIATGSAARSKRWSRRPGPRPAIIRSRACSCIATSPIPIAAPPCEIGCAWPARRRSP